LALVAIYKSLFDDRATLDLWPPPFLLTTFVFCPAIDNTLSLADLLEVSGSRQQMDLAVIHGVSFAPPLTPFAPL